MIVMLVSQISFSDNKLHDFMPVKQLAHALNFSRRFLAFLTELDPLVDFMLFIMTFFSFDLMAVQL